MNTLYWITTLDSIFYCISFIIIVSVFAIIIFSCFKIPNHEDIHKEEFNKG